MQNLQQHAGFTGILASFALAGITGAAITHSHAASVPVVVNGVFGTSPSGTTTPAVNSANTEIGSVYGALDAGAELAVQAPTAGFRAAVIVWTVNAAGTKKIRSTGWFESAGGAALDVPFPAIPLDEIPVAYHTSKAGTTVSGTWTYGKSGSNWNATGMTHSAVVNLFGQPVTGSVSVS